MKISSRFIYILIGTLLALPYSHAQTKPNVVFFLVDDLGITDLSCYGSTFHESPKIDQLATQGMRFTNAYSSHPVCGPSRSAIMTGRFPARLGLMAIGGKIPEGNIPWPKVLQDDGYINYFTGKWHMGNPQSVLENGFNYNMGGHNLGQPSDFYFPYKSKNTTQDVPDMEDGKPGDYLTDALTDKALNFLDQHGKDPFLLYFSYYNVHKPSISNAQGKKEHVDYFNQKLETMPAVAETTRTDTNGGHEVKSLLTQRNAEFAGQIKAVDDSVGRILAKLDELGVADNTLIIFTSDQGSMCTSKIGISSALPYRFGKGFNFEGGIRAPLIVKWPNHTQPGSENGSVTINTDLYPTLMDILGYEKNPAQHIDGISIVPALKGTTIPFDRTFYWAFPKSHPLGHEPSVAVRTGPYKLIHWLENGASELYNVETDISESNDLSKSHPEVTERLLGQLKSWKPIQKVFAPKSSKKKQKKNKKKKSTP